MGMLFFLIFALKHRLWILFRTNLTCTHNLCFEQKFENSQKNSTEMVIFTAMISLYIAWECLRNDIVTNYLVIRGVRVYLLMIND